MNMNEIKELLITIDKTNLGYVKLQNGNLNLEVCKNGIPNNSNQTSYTETVTNEIPEKLNINIEEEVSNTNIHTIKTPLMGTFYEASSPDSPPFVKVGDKVDTNTTLCIVEAMKLMNEITSDVCGEVVEVLVGNEDLVEYNQVLFKIKVA